MADPITAVRDAQQMLRNVMPMFYEDIMRTEDTADALDAVVAEIERQAQELAALRADRDRLDFLDRNLERRLGWEVGFAPAGTVCVTRIFPPNNEPTPIRAALDAARAKEAGDAR